MRATPLLMAGACAVADPYRVAQQAVWDEVTSSLLAYPRRWQSAEEGAMLLGEEVDELWEAVRHNNSGQAAAEAVQVGAMAVRFIGDICGDGGAARARYRVALSQQRAVRAATGPQGRRLASSHEGFGFLRREYDALWAAVVDGVDAGSAASRLAALAVRFIVEVSCDGARVDTGGGR